jgi:hypothetical protein
MFLALAGQSILAAPLVRGHSPQEPPAAPLVTATRQHGFLIPFRIEPPRTPQEQPVEVQLHASGDQGATWEIADRVKPEKGNFVYRAAHDGEYWYAIRTVDAQGVARPEGQLQPQLKVVVDTVAPRLDLVALRGLAGEITARWQAVDPHLKASSFKLEYQAAEGGAWERVAVDTPPSAMRHTSSGDATWWPRASAGSIVVRAEVTDSAGNPAVSQVVVKLDDLQNGTGSPAAGGTAANDRGASPDQGRWPADRATSSPLGHAANSGRTANDPATLDPPAREADRRGAPGDTRQSAQSPVPARPVAQTTRDPAAPSPLNFKLLPAGQQPRMVGSRSFELEYEIESVGSSGVGRVELWGTLDGGRTWSVYGVDQDKESPLTVSVVKEGIYGFRIAVQSGSGLGGQPPAAGDPADVWIGVDLARPQARITAAEVSDDGAELVVTWEVEDDMLAERPISLLFGEASAGPWTPIASGLENSGSYTWRIEGRVPPMIYLRLEARDEAGNVTLHDAPQPVSLDRSRPEGRIRNVRPVK